MLDYAIYGAVLIGIMAAAAFLVARSPTFWYQLVLVIVRALVPWFLKVMAPKDWSQEQLDRIAMGEDPHNISRLAHDKWLQMQALKNNKKLN